MEKLLLLKKLKRTEYFKEKRLQVSIFMSPVNVHVTRYPISGGSVLFSKYHPGEYLVAWHPKASTDNERTTIVVENKSLWKGTYISQIAGASSATHYKLRKRRSNG